jgi:hypothetical protein
VWCWPGCSWERVRACAHICDVAVHACTPESCLYAPTPPTTAAPTDHTPLGPPCIPSAHLTNTHLPLRHAHISLDARPIQIALIALGAPPSLCRRRTPPARSARSRSAPPPPSTPPPAAYHPRSPPPPPPATRPARRPSLDRPASRTTRQRRGCLAVRLPWAARMDPARSSCSGADGSLEPLEEQCDEDASSRVWHESHAAREPEPQTKHCVCVCVRVRVSAGCRRVPGNGACCDCGAPDPDWVSAPAAAPRKAIWF